MEKIKVNMSPNPLDVQTIHASQNDTEAREWEFELHNNGELIDTSEITEQLFFKAYKGGTEQLLPENTSTPTTSPFKSDIKYPQGLLTDQEFTYRQSPTEEDGLAKIIDIKGQTLKWNQICCKGRYFTRGNNEWQGVYTENGVTFTYLDDYTVRITGTPTARTYIYLNRLDDSANYPVKQGEKLLLRCSNAPNGIDVFSSFYNDNTWKGAGPQKSNKYVTVPSDVNKLVCMGLDVQASLIGQTIDVTVSLNVFNLTKMFGSGNEPTEEEFNALFPIYYPYNSGSLIPFNGNGIKTVGKNQIDQSTFVQGSVSGTGADTSTTTRLRSALTKVLPNTQYTLSGVNSGTRIYEVHYYDGSGVWITFQSINREQATFTTLSNAEYIKVLIRHTDNSNIEVAELTALQLEIGSTATSFEPYAESILSLPISTYFPNGMKSAGNVYDELTPRKAITRIGAVDLGSLTYIYDGECFISQLPSDAKVLSTNNETLNSITPLYQINNWAAVKFNKTNMTLGTGVNRYICVFNSSYTDPSAFKQAMQGVYLYYELATPTETSFTTASIVTENAEIPLSNEDGILIGKCTEQLSENPGFFDAKIKLADGDGECYSNKIQLHVERSPQ